MMFRRNAVHILIRKNVLFMSGISAKTRIDGE